MKYGTHLLMVCISFLGCDNAPKSKSKDPTPNASAPAGNSAVAKKTKRPKKKADLETEDVEVPTEEDAETLLVGIWRLDIKSIQADDEIRQLPEAERAAALERRRESMRQVAYEFAADGKLNIFLGGESKQTGTYKIKKVEADPKDKPAKKDKPRSIIFVEASTVGPIGSKSERWQVNVHTKSLHVKDMESGQSFRLYRGGPVFKATP